MIEVRSTGTRSDALDGKPVHVLTVQGDLRFGGDETRSLSFARHVDRQRVRNTVVTVNRPGSRPHPELRTHYAAAGLEVLTLGSTDGGSLATLRDPSAVGPRKAAALAKGAGKAGTLARRLRALVEELDVDVIDAHGEVPALLAVPVGRLTGRPTAVTSYHLESRAESKAMWLAGQFAWGWADALISDSYFAVDLMRRWTLRQPRRLVVVRNGVSRPSTETSPALARCRLGLPEDPGIRVVGQVGRLDALKGHRFVLDAMPMVLARHPDTWFAFVGFPQDPAYPEQLWSRARELGVDRRLAITSYAGDIGDVWPAIDVQVHASLLESLPIAIAEGMSLGKPAVVTSVAGTEEEVTDRVTGLVVPPEDSDALAARLLELLGDPALAERLGAAARERYLHMFQPEAMARRLEDLFVEMARHAGRR